MGKPYSRIGGIDTLAAVSGGTEDIKAAVIHIDLNIHILRFRHDRNSAGRCMDPAAWFCLRHSLHPVYAGFIFQAWINPFSGNHAGHLAHSAYPGLIILHSLEFPVPAVRKSCIHPVDVSCKKRSFFTACAGPDLQDHIPFVVRILRKKKEFQLLFKFRKPYTPDCDLVLQEFFHLRIIFR